MIPPIPPPPELRNPVTPRRGSSFLDDSDSGRRRSINCAPCPSVPPRAKNSSAGAFRGQSSPAAEYGTVEATDADSAIKEAIDYFQITNPEHQKRLMARRVG